MQLERAQINNCSGVSMVRATRVELTKLPPLYSSNFFFKSLNVSMTIAALALNDREKQTYRSRMHYYKTLHTVVSELCLSKKNKVDNSIVNTFKNMQQ